MRQEGEWQCRSRLDNCQRWSGGELTGDGQTPVADDGVVETTDDVVERVAAFGRDTGLLDVAVDGPAVDKDGPLAGSDIVMACAVPAEGALLEQPPISNAIVDSTIDDRRFRDARRPS